MGNDFDAEDIVSEVFVAVTAARRNGGGPTQNVRAYLRTAIERAATKVYAQRARERALGDTEFAAPSHIGGAELWADYVRVLSTAPASWRQVLYHCVFRDCTPEEVSQITGLTVPAVNSVLHRVRVALRAAA